LDGNPASFWPTSSDEIKSRSLKRNEAACKKSMVKRLGETFGFSTSLCEDGLTVALGAPKGAGLVRVYERLHQETEWVQRCDDIDGDE
jgi:hypothetical protein